MTTPVQVGLPQVLLFLIAVIGIGLLIVSLMGLFRGKREAEIFEDEDGNRYRRWRRRRRQLRWKSGLSGIIMLVLAIVLLWLTFAVQAYLGLTSDIKVAHIHATKVENIDHLISVELTTYDQNGQQVADKTYILKGDRWLLQGDIIKFPTWMNIFGIHSGYKLTRLEGQYDDINAENKAGHTAVELNGGDGSFFKTVYQQAWSSPFVEAAYGNAVIIPADGKSYTIYVSQSGLYAKPDK
ncbi:MAG: hypothetical protein NVS2B12_01790 [Ktedonobacteraceae bacterium]